MPGPTYQPRIGNNNRNIHSSNNNNSDNHRDGDNGQSNNNSNSNNNWRSNNNNNTNEEHRIRSNNNPADSITTTNTNTNTNNSSITVAAKTSTSAAPTIATAANGPVAPSGKNPVGRPFGSVNKFGSGNSGSKSSTNPNPWPSAKEYAEILRQFMLDPSKFTRYTTLQLGKCKLTGTPLQPEWLYTRPRAGMYFIECEHLRGKGTMSKPLFYRWLFFAMHILSCLASHRFSSSVWRDNVFVANRRSPRNNSRSLRNIPPGPHTNLLTTKPI